MAHRTPAPTVLRGRRFMTWFATCGLVTLAVGSVGGFAIAADWVPGQLQWPAFWACILVGLAGVTCAFAPLLLGMPCERCDRRIFVRPEQPRCGGRSPIRFYCPACDIEWDTGAWWGEE
jgi:hypothetical protein